MVDINLLLVLMAAQDTGNGGARWVAHENGMCVPLPWSWYTRGARNTEELFDDIAWELFVDESRKFRGVA